MSHKAEKKWPPNNQQVTLSSSSALNPGPDPVGHTPGNIASPLFERVLG